MYHIHGKKIIGSILLLWLPFLSQAQGFLQGNYNYKGFQQKHYYFGLTLGVNRSTFHLDRSKKFIGNEQYRITESQPGMGFNLNMIANLKLGDNFDFRFLPGFAFSERSLEYTDTGSGAMQKEQLENVYFEMPFHVRFKSAPYKDKRVFVVGGLKYSYDVASNSNSKKTELRFSPHDFQYEVGIGMQFFYPYFIFSPEIKFSRGLSNSLIYDNRLTESNIIESAALQYFTISFHFEG